MKNTMMNNIKRKINKGMRKSNFLMEMAEDFKDMISNAKNMTKKK